MPSSTQNTCGVKRRRRDEREPQEDKVTQLRRKLHHALRELRKAVKKAKNFEVQKTLKKLRDARVKDLEGDLTKDLEAQMETLKHLSYDQLARLALLTKLKKNKTLYADSVIQVVSAELASNLVPSGPPRTPTAKVQSRILSCKVLASEVVSTVEGLRTTLDSSFRPGNRDFQSSPHALRESKTAVDRGEDILSDANPAGQESGGNEGTSSDEATSVADSAWESGTVGGRSGLGDSAAGSVGDHDDVTFDHGGDDSDDALSEDATGNKRPRPHGSEDQSEFLPSLSAGFTRGDSGNEFSDSETRLVDGMRRNRRGQRARRAIWEKKFGKDANHIKTRQETPRRRSDAVQFDRRFGKGRSSLRHPTPTRSRAHTKQLLAHTSGTTWASGGDLQGKQDGPLHPSWEAKKKHRTPSIVPPQGTKIVFSESSQP